MHSGVTDALLQYCACIDSDLLQEQYNARIIYKNGPELRPIMSSDYLDIKDSMCTEGSSLCWAKKKAAHHLQDTFLTGKLRSTRRLRLTVVAP